MEEEIKTEVIIESKETPQVIKEEIKVERKKESNAGRPTVFTESVLQKLREAFLMGCTDEESCFYANIANGSLYNYQKEHPEFLEQKDQLKQNPFVKARRAILTGLDDPKIAIDFMQRKKKDEFSLKSEVDLTSKGEKISISDAEFAEALKIYGANKGKENINTETGV